MTQDNSSGRSTVSRRRVLAGFAAGGAVAIAGCGALGGGGGSGTIVASGSNTVAPITQAAAESYENAHDDVSVEVDPQGTGAGFEEFCQANSDVQSASRDILDDEADRCADNDVDAGQFTVGQDGLAVGVHEDNDWCDEITLDELNAIWDFESDVDQWSDVRDDWPDEDIYLHARDDASGTFDYFTLEINGEVARIRDDYSATSQTHEIWDAVANNEYALGWGGVGHLHEQQDDGATLKTVAVESDHPDFAGDFFYPVEENIESGAYSPLARPLFIFINTASLEDNFEMIGNFARHYFNDQIAFATDVGFFATPPEWAEENHDDFDALVDQLGLDIDDLDEPRDVTA